VRVSVLDPGTPAPAAVAAHQTVGSFTDAKSIEKFVKERKIDILTVEIEHVDVDAIESAADTFGVQALPSPDTLRTIQDKLLQNQHFQCCNIAVPAFAGVPDEVRPRGVHTIRGVVSQSDLLVIVIRSCQLSSRGGKQHMHGNLHT
jgi:phosphoribosylaminoimidazole carboxylase (NCAIR synthetase)